MKFIPSLVSNNLSQTPPIAKLILRQGGSLLCLTGLRRACFHSDGNERFSIQMLIKLVTSSARTGDTKRKINGEMPSTPTALLGLRWSKMLRIRSTVGVVEF